MLGRTARFATDAAHTIHSCGPPRRKRRHVKDRTNIPSIRRHDHYPRNSTSAGDDRYGQLHITHAPCSDPRRLSCNTTGSMFASIQRLCKLLLLTSANRLLIVSAAPGIPKQCKVTPGPRALFVEQADVPSSFLHLSTCPHACSLSWWSKQRTGELLHVQVEERQELLHGAAKGPTAYSIRICTCFRMCRLPDYEIHMQ